MQGMYGLMNLSTWKKKIREKRFKIIRSFISAFFSLKDLKFSAESFLSWNFTGKKENEYIL